MLESIGYDAAVARWARPASATDASVGRVVGLDRGVVHLLTRTGPQRATVGGTLLGRIAGNPKEGPCPGDWCLLREWPDHRTTVERLLPRRTALARVEAEEPGRPGCANADVVAVVVATHPTHPTHPTPPTAEVQRLVTHVRESGARPLVVLMTADRFTGPPAAVDDESPPFPGMESVTVDVHSGRGVDDLRGRLAKGLTMTLVGTSRTARAALTKALVGARPLAPGAVRGSARSRSRYGGTRGSVELVALPTGGVVLDGGDLGRADSEVPRPAPDIGRTRP